MKRTHLSFAWLLLWLVTSISTATPITNKDAQSLYPRSSTTDSPSQVVTFHHAPSSPQFQVVKPHHAPSPPVLEPGALVVTTHNEAGRHGTVLSFSNAGTRGTFVAVHLYKDTTHSKAKNENFLTDDVSRGVAGLLSLQPALKVNDKVKLIQRLVEKIDGLKEMSGKLGTVVKTTGPDPKEGFCTVTIKWDDKPEDPPMTISGPRTWFGLQVA